MSGEAIYAIVGPTAAGKTRAAFELARMIGGEIISVDSRQIYRYMDVGTDKISQTERRVVPHHLIDVADPDEIFTAADFVERAAGAVRRIVLRGKIPILAGGTPMYYRALEGNMLSLALPSDENIRAELRCELETKGSQVMHAELAAADPEAAIKEVYDSLDEYSAKKLDDGAVNEIIGLDPVYFADAHVYYSSPAYGLADIAEGVAEHPVAVHVNSDECWVYGEYRVRVR